jgi:hypothetical protein
MCRVESKVLESAEGWFAKRRANWERRFDRLEAFLAEEEAQQVKPPRSSKSSKPRRGS